MSLRAQMEQARTKLARDLIFALHTQANLVEEYSSNPDNPNVSAWLRSGACEQILMLEQRAYANGRRSRGYQPMVDGIDYDSSEQ